MGEIHTRGHGESAFNTGSMRRAKTGTVWIFKLIMSSHFSDTYYRLHRPLDPLCRGGNQQEWRCSGSGGKLGIFSRGSASVKNLRILATCCFWQRHGQRGGSTLFSIWLQTKRGFGSTHDSHGNGFWEPTIMWWKGFLQNKHKPENITKRDL